MLICFQNNDIDLLHIPVISSCIKENIFMSWSYLTGKADNYTKKKKKIRCFFFQEESKWKIGLELEKIFQESACKCDHVFQKVRMYFILATLFHSIASDQHLFVQGKKIFYFTLLNLFDCCWKMVSTVVCTH